METRLKRHRKKLREGGVTRFSVQLSRSSVETLRELSRKHDKTQREVMELGIHAADRLLSGQLQLVSKPSLPGTATTALAAPADHAVKPIKTLTAPVVQVVPDHVTTASTVIAPDAPEGGEAWWPDNAAELLEVRRDDR